MQFAMILSGHDAPIPAPRIDAIDSATGIGIYDEQSGRILQPDYSQVLKALPVRLRRHYARDLPRCWFIDGSRIIDGQNKGPLPYLPITDRNGKRIETAYFAAVQS